MNERIQYIIALKPEQVELMTELLAAAGVAFDPVESMIAMPRDNVEEGIFTGEDGEWLTEKVNGYLGNSGEQDQVAQPFYEMTPLARRDFLTLATLHCDWHNNEIQEMDRREWETFQNKHPEATSTTPRA